MDAKINVLDIRDTYEIGGPGKTILETFRAIDSSRFSLHLAVFVAKGQGIDTPFLSAAKDVGVPVHILRGANQYDPALIWRLAALVKALRIEIVHAHEVQSDVIAYLASRAHRAATISTAHGWIATRRKARMFRALDQLVMRGFERVIAVSGQIERDLIASGVSPRRVVLLHNAIVLERYRRTGDSTYVAGLVGHHLVRRPVIASVGRLSPEKGHRDLVEALGLLADRGVKLTAVLAGDGPERAALGARVRTLGLQDSVILPGYVSHPERLLDGTDLLVLPSHTEGLPNAALEAMAMEVPVLATRVGGTPEVVHDGETGRLVEPRSPKELADAIADCASEPDRWRAMGRRGREVVAGRFDFQKRTRKLEHLYFELARAVA